MVTVASGRNKNTLESEVNYKKVRNYLIPNEWDLIKLGDISTKVGSGKTPRGGEAVYQKSGIPFIRSQNVLNNRLELNGISYISESIHDEMKSTKVIPNDVLLNITGASIGRCCIVPDSFKEGNLNQHVCIIRTKDTLDRNYLVNILLSPIGQNQIMNNQAGGNREGLNFDQIRKFDIPLPPLKEQQKIASILSTWDKAIELKEKLIEQKKEQKKGLMQKLLTGKVRLPGFEGEWESVPVEKLCSLIMGKTPSRNNDDYWGRGYKWISIADLKSKYILQTSEEITEKALKETKIKAIPKGTVIMSFKLTIGRVGITGEDMYSNEAIVSLRNKDKKILDDEYLYYYLSSIDVTKFGSIAAKGVTLNSDSLKEIIIKLPTISEQVAIREIMSKLDLNIELLEKELSLLKEQKNGLMQLLLTGKVRVKV